MLTRHIAVLLSLSAVLSAAPFNNFGFHLRDIPNLPSNTTDTPSSTGKAIDTPTPTPTQSAGNSSRIATPSSGAGVPLTSSVSSNGPPKPSQQKIGRPSLLLYSRCGPNGYYHTSIPKAKSRIDSMASQLGWNITISDDPSHFNSTHTLKQFKAIALLSTTWQFLDTPQQILNFKNYILGGGNLAGIHAASDGLLKEPWFSATLGGRFRYHSIYQNASYTTTTSSFLHPSTSSIAWMKEPWIHTDEVYNFITDPRTYKTTILLNVDDASYTDAKRAKYNGTFNNGPTHPISWCRDGSVTPLDMNLGRKWEKAWVKSKTWYTALGHSDESWDDPIFLQHVSGGLMWVLGGTGLCL